MNLTSATHQTLLIAQSKAMCGAMDSISMRNDTYYDLVRRQLHAVFATGDVSYVGRVYSPSISVKVSFGGGYPRPIVVDQEEDCDTFSQPSCKPVKTRSELVYRDGEYRTKGVKRVAR